MKPPFVLDACILVLALILLGPIAGAADAPVPPELQFPSDEREALRLEAKGVQIYECKPKPGNAGSFEWMFKAPEADLFDGDGKTLGKHYAGPTWESSDGSKVVGEVRARTDAPIKGAILWLRLSAKSVEGSGALGHVKSIQRINTAGGAAPLECTESDSGKLLRVPYAATYVFSVKK
jgi:hypothetical protein